MSIAPAKQHFWTGLISTGLGVCIIVFLSALETRKQISYEFANVYLYVTPHPNTKHILPCHSISIKTLICWLCSRAIEGRWQFLCIGNFLTFSSYLPEHSRSRRFCSRCTIMILVTWFCCTRACLLWPSDAYTDIWSLSTGEYKGNSRWMHRHVQKPLYNVYTTLNLCDGTNAIDTAYMVPIVTMWFVFYR